MDTVMTTQELEALFVNNGDLERLGVYLNRFNSTTLASNYDGIKGVSCSKRRTQYGYRRIVGRTN